VERKCVRWRYGAGGWGWGRRGEGVDALGNSCQGHNVLLVIAGYGAMWNLFHFATCLFVHVNFRKA
jgi:hypothetical protein